MEVVYASDQNYYPYVYVSIETLLETNSNEDIHINYVFQNVDQDKCNKLSELGKKYGSDIKLIPFQMPDVYKKLPSYKGTGSKTTYAKFLFASMFPDEDKVLFLDPDTIVLGSIRPLIEMNLGNNLVGGVIECLPYYHKDAALMGEEDRYINGGVLLCNLRMWRKTNFEKTALERLEDTSKNFNYDQGIINEICSGRIKIIDPRFNVLAEVFAFKSSTKIQRRYRIINYYKQEDIDAAISNPIIIHFTEFLYNKPMSKHCDHPYAAYFQEKLQATGLNISLSDDKIDKRKQIRKWFFENTPFDVYLVVEEILDIRRHYHMRHPRIKEMYEIIRQHGKK